MQKIVLKDIKDLPRKLKMIEDYINKSKIYFKELDKILNSIELSDKDKLIMINNQYKEFESSVLK